MACINFLDDSNCCGCKNCLNVCPKKAIGMVENSEGFLYPKIDKKKCVNCGRCLKVCPMLNNLNNIYQQKCFAAKLKNQKMIKESTSGGLFATLANYVIENQGLVYGSYLDQNHKVYHIEAKTLNEVNKIKGSKYVYSDLGDVFQQVKLNLINNKLVLFVGLPCQVAALNLFLRHKYDNLITIDLICHGTPNNKLFDKYLNYIEQKDNIKILNYQFRSKLYNDWIDAPFNSNIVYKKDKKIINKKKKLKNDFYTYSFLKARNYRESCYNCKYASRMRVGDITLGDFWGIKKVSDYFGDSTDVSAVIINTNQGLKYFNYISSTIDFISVNFMDIAKYNGQLIKPSKRPKCRENWYKDFDQENFIQKKMIEFYLSRSLSQLIPTKIKKHIKKMINYVKLNIKR